MNIDSKTENNAVLVLNIESVLLEDLKSHLKSEQAYFFLVNHSFLIDRYNNSENVRIISFNEILQYVKLDISIFREHKQFIDALFKDFIYHSFRSDTNMSISLYEFNKAVNYWFSFFLENKIKLVVNYTVFHGSIIDIASKIASYLGINAIERINIGKSSFAMYNIMSKSFVLPSQTSNKPNLQNLSGLKTNRMIIDHLKSRGLKLRFARWSEGLLVFVLNVIGVIWTQKIYLFFKSLLTRDYRLQLKLRNLSHSDYHYRKMTDYYRRNIVEPNLDCNYFYFSLNFEPEAAINGKSLILSQLYWIETISTILPPGTVIYVKEHPHLFNFNNLNLYYYLNNIQFYKNIHFYEKITELKNVYLVDSKINSKDMIMNSNLTICLQGSVVYETIDLQKPILILEDEFSIGSMINGVHTFNNLEDVQSILNLYSHYDKNLYNVNYKNKDEIYNKYLYNLDSDPIKTIDSILKSDI